MDYGGLPPEVNSGRIYAGPGAGPLLTAAAAWDGLAAELQSTATGYTSVISELTGSPWVGPAAASMVSAVVPYVAWLSAAATTAEQTSIQAKAAAVAYEFAFALTVPPPVIAANRALLLALTATNFFGQNLPAIAAAESQYAEMWAQDATAMYTYAGASAIASELSPFTEPAQTTNQAGLAAQAAAVAHAVATPAGTSAQGASAGVSDLLTVSGINHGITQLLHQLSSQAATVGVRLSNTWFAQQVGQITTSMRTTLGRSYDLINFSSAPSFNFASIAQQLTFGPGGTTAGAGGAWYPTPQFAALGAAGWHWHGSAGLASSIKIGGLSVPPSWGGAPGAVEQAVTKVVGTNFVISPGDVTAANGVNAVLRGGVSLGSRASERAGNMGVRYGVRFSVLARPPSAG